LGFRYIHVNPVRRRTLCVTRRAWGMERPPGAYLGKDRPRGLDSGLVLAMFDERDRAARAAGAYAGFRA